MLTHEELARIALRHDTSMARAMLRALGVPVPRSFRAGVPVRADYIDPDVLWCFRNHGSPMDLVR